MRKILFFAFLALGLSGYAQDTLKPAYDQALQDRQLLYDSYTAAKSAFDSTETSLQALAMNMEKIILADDTLITETLAAETGRADSLALRVQELEKAQTASTVEMAKQNLYFLIAAGAAGLFLILFIVVLVLMLLKGKKDKKITSHLAEKDQELALVEERLEAAKNEMKKEVDQLSGTLEETKSKAERESKNFTAKEAEYKSQVLLIEDKIKKANQKESDLNYQIFQLELKLKNELESTIAQKCALENKVIDLERELSEIRLRMNETHQPQVNVQELENKIEGLQWELSEARQKIAEGPQVPEGEVQELHDKVVALERELSESRMNQELDHEVPLTHDEEVMDLKGKVDWYANEAVYFREVIARQENEKEQLHTEINQLRERADEADLLRARIDELKQFLDQFRQNS